MKALLEGRELGVFQRGRWLLRDTSLSIGADEIVTLIGPNGAGKSTLIRVLLGLIKPDAGTVKRRQGLKVGYMPQQMVIDPTLPLTVKRFLALAGGDRRQIEYSLGLTGVAHLLDQPLQRLSGGEFQRVLLARAIYRQPDLLVLDEPVQGVDVAGQSALYQLIQNLRDEIGCGVLMVSHDLHLVMAATDRVICLNQHICCEGHPASVSTDPAFLRLFGERQDPGVAIYTHHHDHTHEHHHGVDREPSVPSQE